ncbi:MAG TPA: DUF1702 family protein [Pyrinomonadaceae bacterium]|jgi:hypothetical protein
MALSLASFRQSILGIPLEETTFARRGFCAGTSSVQQRLEKIGRVFVQGYHAALDENDIETLAQRLNTIEQDFRGFAFEGAAMGLALLDHLTPWKKNRLPLFLVGPGTAHTYMVHVGVGWALARIPWLRRNVEKSSAHLDPLLRWLAIDGYGFHEGYFHWHKYIKGEPHPLRLKGYARRAFDQGLGRSLWFVDGADVKRIPITIAGFPEQRRADLWSGVGLACTYAGGVEPAEMESLKLSAQIYHSNLAQGAAFAAKARQRAGNETAHADRACRIFCGVTATEAAQVADIDMRDLSDDEESPAYEIWRQRIQSHFASDVALA